MKIESMISYLGIEVNDVLGMAEQLTSELRGKAELALTLVQLWPRAKSGHQLERETSQ